MNTPIKYQGSVEHVPYPAYRCPATAQQKPGHTHLCRRHSDHEDKHRCICGRDWEPVA